jgi:hypothetical protein
MATSHGEAAIPEGEDEEHFLDLVLANERVLEWVDVLETPGNASR